MRLVLSGRLSIPVTVSCLRYKSIISAEEFWRFVSCVEVS